MLTDARIESILTRLPSLSIGVLGDLFLDRYLDLDGALTEPSLETGLDAWQVVHVRCSAGAAGTILNNLAALGVGVVCPVSLLGEDGEGYELRRALDALRVVDPRWLSTTADRRTPTYTKPLLHEQGHPARELNRLDIKNRVPLLPDLEHTLLGAFNEAWRQADAWIVLDQVSEPNCGVVTQRVRALLAERAAADPGRFVLADSRERIGSFRGVCLKPNERECRRALGTPEGTAPDVVELSRRVGRPVFCTRGAAGILLADAGGEPSRVETVPGYPVSGPIDIVGAGDSTSAGIACAVAAGASLAEAAAFGNLVASITIQQLGTTGTASPAQVRQRWREVGGAS
jgi:bifunctional ADP-heptose synthase (sugar kinase/adenylyltransferase)